jgi:very-short-patch-repair endonuclease
MSTSMSTTITPVALREAIAETLWSYVKAYDLAEVCQYLGLAPPGKDENPSFSKRAYVRSRLQGKGLDELVPLARRVAEEYGDEELRHLVGRLGTHGVDGELKNLIFAADGPKPRIVLRDAINNVIEIVEHAQHCLVYDQPLDESGLTWQKLTVWWAEQDSLPSGDERRHASALYGRLARSLASDAERMLFRTYCGLYAREGGFDLPALIPQVYLHYDPYTRQQLGNREGPLERQRMDFLLLMSRRSRIVLEVDGRHHYADETGRADPARYGRLVAEDRALHLAGYEVYRFGGHEFTSADASVTLVSFFEQLLSRHGHQPGDRP